MNRRIAATAKSYMRIPFRRAVLRGLGVLLPPLLTIVILLWIFNTVQDYVLVPIESAAKHALTWALDDSLDHVPPGAQLMPTPNGAAPRLRFEDQVYVELGSGDWIPAAVYDRVQAKPGTPRPTTREAFYHRYVELKYLKRHIVLPVFLSLFILSLYMLGRFLAYGIGRVLFNAMEKIINQLPIIRTVYTSVKQVTDFVFSENEMEFTRVVAVEHPRRGVWSLGFVTGEGMRGIMDVAGEPIMTVLVPTSPMPATGFTIQVRRSETIDLDITIDQAFQFIVSCGVVVPLHQQYHPVGGQVTAAITEHLGAESIQEPSLGE